MLSNVKKGCFTNSPKISIQQLIKPLYVVLSLFGLFPYSAKFHDKKGLTIIKNSIYLNSLCAVSYLHTISDKFPSGTQSVCLRIHWWHHHDSGSTDKNELYFRTGYPSIVLYNCVFLCVYKSLHLRKNNKRYDKICWTTKYKYGAGSEALSKSSERYTGFPSIGVLTADLCELHSWFTNLEDYFSLYLISSAANDTIHGDSILLRARADAHCVAKKC